MTAIAGFFVLHGHRIVRSVPAVAVIAAVLSLGCAAQGVPEAESAVPNGAAVVKIAEIGMCVVYRIEDGTLRTLWLTLCQGNVSAALTTGH